jgi:hypothetical protein
MAVIRRFGLTDLLLLLLTLAVAAGARIGYLASIGGAGSQAPLRVQQPLTTDLLPARSSAQDEVKVLVHNLSQRWNWFRCAAPFAPHGDPERTAHVAPGYPSLLALLARGVGLDNLDRWVRWLQCGLGTLTAGLLFLFARRAFRSLTVGVLAGLLAALHPFWIIGVATIDDGVLSAFLLAAALFLGARGAQTGGALTSLLFGLTLAGLALVRAALLPFAFVAIIWFLLRTRHLAGGWLAALVGFLGFVIGLAPWTVRNYQVFQEPVPIVDSVYLHLWIGNNPRADGGPLTPEMLRTAPTDELRQIEHQPRRYARLGKEVLQEVRDHPAETLQRRLRATLMFFVGDRWLADGTVAEPTSAGEGNMPEWLARWYPTVLQGTLLGLLLLAVLGWRLSYGWRFESMPAALAAIFVPLPYILGHAGALSGSRLPLDGVLLCYVAFTLACLLPGGTELREAPGAGVPTQEAP